MPSTLWKSIYVSPIVLGMTALLSSGVMAAPESKEIAPAANGNAKDLILNKASGASNVKVAAGEPTPATTTPEVSNGIVKPGDWQYTALQELSTKYGCNPNFNNQPVLAIEFARGLNGCINRVETSLALQQQSPRPVKPVQSIPPAPPAPTVQPNAVTREDLEVLKRLTQEFRAQLTEVDNKIVAEDKKVAQLQATQFSTTTKLKGEAVINVSGAFSGATSNNVVVGNRVRLLFQSSFYGPDALYTRIATGNQSPLSGTFKNGFTAEGTQVFEGIPFGGLPNTTGIDWLAYQFPLNKTGNIYIAATGGLLVDFAPTYGSNFDNATGGNGALSLFAESNPIYKIAGGTGVGVQIPFAEDGLTSVNVGYFAGNGTGPAGPAASPPAPTGPNVSATGNGLFNGSYALFGQANFKLSDKLTAGVSYINSYNTPGTSIYGFGGAGALVGTGFANANPNGLTANSFGAQFAYNASTTLAFNGFVSNTSANKGAGIGNQSIWSYGGGVSLPNIDGKGGLVGLLVGAEPYVGGLGSVPFHVEGFYKYTLSDNLSITPGIIYLTAPNQTSGNSAVIGVVRTTFTF
jgi:hypothetical protein